MQGVYNSTKHKNENAVSGVKFESTEPSYKTAKVLTIDSFAAIPVSKATTARQSPNPHKVKMGETAFPITASMLSELFSVKWSDKSKDCKNHTMIEAPSRTVPAFVRKSFNLSHM